MHFEILFNDQEMAFDVTRQGDDLTISYDGTTHQARLIQTDGESFVLEVMESGPDGFISRKRIRAVGYRDGDQRQLWANGRLVRYERLRKRGSDHNTELDVASLSASIPAVVSEILVEIGAEVKAGDKLILLESMKMILPIQAPRDGQVTAINCAAGESVEPGVLLVTLSEESTPKTNQLDE